MVLDANRLVPSTYASGADVPDDDWLQVVDEVTKSEMDERSAIAYAKGRIEELRKERAKKDKAA